MIFKTKEQKPVSGIDEAKLADKNAKHIASFIGLERSDILFYLAKILQERNTAEGYRTVLLIDNSVNKDLFQIVNKIDDNEVTLKRMTFMQDIDFDEEYFKNYAYVLIYHGMDIDMDIIHKSDLVVCSVDYNPNHYMACKACLADYQGNIQMIFRDWVSKKIKESVIEQEMEFNSEQIEMRSIIKADLQDYAAYIQLMQNGNQRISQSELSELMLETLRYLTEQMTGITDEKVISKMIKNAK